MSIRITWRPSNLMQCLWMATQKSSIMCAADLIAIRRWVRGHVVWLTGADTARFCDTKKFAMFTCRLFAVNNNTATRQKELLLLVSVTHCREKTLRVLVRIISVGFKHVTRYTSLPTCATGPRKKLFNTDIGRAAVIRVILWVGITSIIMLFFHIVGLSSS